MRTRLFYRLLAQRASRRFYSNAKRSVPENRGDLHEISGSNWRAALKEEIAIGVPKERDAVCIYRVPINIRQVEPKAILPVSSPLALIIGERKDFKKWNS
ncbi:hypothetical protein SLA2020_492730 [Shorea laevis]